MSSPSFDPSKISGFGTMGQESAQKMSEAAKSHNLSIAYDSNANKFTVLGSSSLNREAVKAIFNEKQYAGWRPEVLKETDTLGNRVVKLIPCDIPGVRPLETERLFSDDYTRCKEKAGGDLPLTVGGFTKTGLAQPEKVPEDPFDGFDPSKHLKKF